MGSSLRRSSPLLFTFVLGSIASTAHADDKSAKAAECGSAAERGQELRDERKLLEARETLKTCAQASCPAFIQKDCVRWLDEIEKNLSTVVLQAKEGSAYLTDVRVSVDGKPLVTELDGRAVAMNPGVHAFHFAKADGKTIDVSLPVREGEKNQSVLATFPSATAAAAPSPAPAAESASPWRTVGWGLGGLGLVGLGIGAVFGFMAASDKSDADCDNPLGCKGGPLASARDEATIANVGFIAGGVLLAGGAALVLFAPRGRGAHVALQPAGFVLRGAW